MRTWWRVLRGVWRRCRIEIVQARLLRDQALLKRLTDTHDG